ncbi:hypothetical protein JN533_26580 [Staphylococcus aureus]|nr:hypothetical protein JN533_26580 [Staphylococcus aureus]
MRNNCFDRHVEAPNAIYYSRSRWRFLVPGYLKPSTLTII